MLTWSGASQAHLSYIPRKPHPLGIQLKTICDGVSGVFLGFDPVEGAEQDAKKEFYSDFGSTTATTLRLAKRWFGSRRVVVADSWFGSLKTCEELRENGLHSVLCVKTGHRGYPKQRLLDECTERGQVVTLKTDVTLGWHGEGETVPIVAMCHRDKKPMTLVASCGLTLQGPSRVRHWYTWEKGAIVHRAWTLEQPHLMAVYRSNFNAIDQLNKETFGRSSLCEAIGTKSWWKRVWMGLLAMSVTNAYHAYAKPWEKKASIDRFEFAEQLANGLLANRWVAVEEEAPSRTLGEHTH